MEETVSPLRRMAGLLIALALIAAITLTTLAGGGQNGSAGQRGGKVKVEDATYLDNGKVKAKPGFELFVEGNKIYARQYSSNTKGTRADGGGYVCTCAGSGGGDCIPAVDTSTGDGHCFTPKTENRCSHCKIAFER